MNIYVPSTVDEYIMYSSINWDTIFSIARRVDENLKYTIVIGIIIIALAAFIGIPILLNQRKIRKELRQLREMMEKDNPENL